MKPATRVYLLVEVECSKEVPDLKDKAAGRIYSMPGVEGATAMLLDTPESFKLAQAQMENSRG